MSVGSCTSTSRRSGPTIRDIIYVRGTGQGERGPDADKGSYDSLAFWARAGVAAGARRPEYDLRPSRPRPGFGDSIGAMTIAGGIMGALFHRERTGEATTVDVSLLGVGLWAMGQALALSLLLDRPWAPPPADSTRLEPAVAHLPDHGRARRSGSPACRPASTGRPSARPSAGPIWRRDPSVRRPRVADGQQRRGHRSNWTRCSPRATLGRVAPAPGRASTASGRSCRTRSRRPTTPRPSPTATSRTAGPPPAHPFRLAAAPVQFDEEPAVPRRAPELQRARRQHPRRARVRLGRHRRPQGPRRRRLTPATSTPPGGQ